MASSRHPLLITSEQRAIAFLPLLRSYVELYTVYLLDQPFEQGRVRLTNTVTGDYVIYGKLGKLSGVEDMGVDEQLCMNIPSGYLRVRTAPGQFEFLEVTENIEYLGNSASLWGIRVSGKSTELGYTMELVPASVVTTVRELQYDRVSLAYHRYART